MMVSWKTSLGGVITAVGTALTQVPNVPGWVHSIGAVLMAVGPLIIGLTARDANKSSEDQGIKN